MSRTGRSLHQLRVADVLIRHPKTLPADATVARARQALLDEHVHMLLLVEGDGRLAGTLVREDLPAHAAPAGPARPYSELDQRTLDATLPAEAARQILLAQGQRRRAVVDAEGRLVGLLCLKRRLTAFCSDADVTSRGTGPRKPDNRDNLPG